ncbi:MAG: hypothetical protein IT453_03165 [Planctomycetes bacterium]|nr:hypothetical protein [Planctomycetota bacterium]
MKLSLPLGVVPFALASLASAQQYELVDLGIAGVADSEAFALNERSDVVGSHDTAFTGEKHAFLWTKLPQYGLPAGATDLGTLGGTFADAQGINALGQTTGGAFTASSPFSQRAYLWLPAPAYGLPAGMNALGTLGGTQVASRGEGINALGQLAGTSFGGNPGDQTAFLWLPVADLGLASGMHSLGTLGGASSFGVDLNAHGEVVGRSDASGGTTHAFLWLPSAKYGLAAGLNDLTPGASVFAEAAALNDLGEVVGTELTASFALRAWLWLPSAHYGLPAGVNTLPPLAPHPDVSALDVNAHGMVVGYASTVTGVQLAVLWENGAWKDLNTLVAGGSGWTLDVANAINDAGDIAGRGTFNGASRAFLLRRTSTPPLATYCTAKTTSNGCVPRIDGHGSPSVANGASFQVTCIGLRNQKSALLLYGSNGRASVPFSGGTLCVAAPLKRTPLASTGGSAVPASDCSGVFQLDFNAFAAGLAGGNPSPALSVPGTTIDVQTWGRDPGFSPPNNTQLSDALEYVVAP